MLIPESHKLTAADVERSEAEAAYKKKLPEGD